MIVGRLDKRTAKTLMRALYVVVSHVLADEFSQVRLTERDDASASQVALESTTISISWVPFYSGRQPATLLRSALKVLESANYPTIQFRHITGSCG